jgi:molybdenum cofactor cytidylyltransferase
MTAGKQNIGLVILAAGSSSRLGTPKQLLPYTGKTLLQNSIDVAIGCDAGPVLVVLGSEAEIIKDNIHAPAARVIMNDQWEEGMASSIRCGLNALMQQYPLTEAVVIMVCDQPYANQALVNKLISVHHNTGKPIVASRYDHITGVPALFHKTIFPELLQLKGDVGAKSIIQRHAGEVDVVTFSKGGVDIDTAADYKELSKGNLKI